MASNPFMPFDVTQPHTDVAPQSSGIGCIICGAEVKGWLFHQHVRDEHPQVEQAVIDHPVYTGGTLQARYRAKPTIDELREIARRAGIR